MELQSRPWKLLYRTAQAGVWGRGADVSRARGLALISGNTGSTPSIVCTSPAIYASPYQPHREKITPARCLALDALPGKAKCDGRRGGLSPESVTANFYHCPSPDATTKGSRLASPRGKVYAHNYPVIAIRENRLVLAPAPPHISCVTLGESPHLTEIPEREMGESPLI